MSEYGKRNRNGSRYRSRRRDPYRSLTRDLYSRLLNRYKPLRSLGGSGGGGSRSTYRPSVERYHPAAEYKPKTQERAPSQGMARRESSPRVELPAYKPEPDIEQLLKDLEKRFDARLHERVLEMMEKQFDETRAEVLRRYTLPESALDEDVQAKIEQLQDPEDQRKEHMLEISQDVVNRDNSSLEQEQTQPMESQPEALDESSFESMPEMEKRDTQTLVDVNEVVDPEGIVESVDIPERPPEEAMEPPDSVGEIAKMVVEDPVLALDLEPEMLADIEALYNELKLELEPEEQVEPES